MTYYRDEYGEDNTIFLFTSDDMKWVRKSKIFRQEKNLFMVGCGNGEDVACVGKDFALLAACNHTITSRGSYGQWSTYFAGGEIYTEYGPFTPEVFGV